jgi:hypothetical protein
MAQHWKPRMKQTKKKKERIDFKVVRINDLLSLPKQELQAHE